MMHKYHQIPQLKNWIEESHPSDERDGLNTTPNEMYQMSHSQKETFGRNNRFEVNSLGIITGVKKGALVYATR